MLIDSAMQEGAGPAGPATMMNTPQRGGNRPPVDESQGSTGADEISQNDEVSGDQATAQEQEAFEKVVLAGLAVLHGIANPSDPDNATPEQQQQSDQLRRDIVANLKARADQPTNALADTTVMLVDQLDGQAQGKIPREVIIPAAGELLDEVAKVAQRSGAFQVPEQAKRAAVTLTVLMLMQKYKATREEIQEFLNGLDKKQFTAEIQSLAQTMGEEPTNAVV